MNNQPPAPTRDAALKRQRREQLKQLGVCIDCNCQRTAPGRNRCQGCRERLALAWKRWKQRKQQGTVFTGEAILAEPSNQFER